MYWFRRPPYLRWAGAATLVVIALALELRPTVTHPYTTAAVAAGESFEAVEWREVPAGVLPATDLAGVATRDVGPGEPVVPRDVTTAAASPEGWWALALELPGTFPPGTAAKLVTDSGALVPALILASADSDPLGGITPAGLVAVPEERAAEVATAVARREVTVLVEAR